MRIRLTLGLTDRPGTLLKALEKIAMNGGNIISIVHNREQLTGGYVPVSLSVEFPSREHFERARAGIEEAGIPVLGTESLERRIETVIIIGSLSVDRLEKVFEGRGEIISLAFGGGSRSPHMRVMFSVNSEDRERVLEALEELAEKNNCVLVSEEA
jgi:ACT domain-containing protein